MQTLLGKHWHHLPGQEVVELLDSNEQAGLDLFEIKHRQERFGANRLTPRKGQSPLVRFLLQFHNPLIYILLASAVITAVVKDIKDALIIFGVVLVNAILGYIQEARAEKAIEALAETMSTEASVIRAGKAARIAAAELVPGDIVTLKSGDKVPADLRVLRSRDLQIAEAALTGESQAVYKDAQLSLSPETSLADRRNMAYASTLVTYGQGTGIVTAIGDSTEVGRVSQLIASAESLATPLTRKIEQFSRIILYGILIVAAIAFGVGVARGDSVIDTLTAAIALAVAMIPEGLPAALTVTLAIGVSRMARRRAIIRRLPAVEALGSTTVICSDKTGTLTQNQMTVQEIYTGGVNYAISGVGYEPDGKISSAEQADVAPQSGNSLHETIIAGILANDSTYTYRDGQAAYVGDPTEVALLVLGKKAGCDLDGQVTRDYPRLDGIPFESEHQYMATLHRQPVAFSNASNRAFLKGGVEVILEKCVDAVDADGKLVTLDAEAIHRQAELMAQRGFRVLAFARKDFDQSQQTIQHRDFEGGLTFLGLQGMIDPPRPESIAAVSAAQKAGIRVKMITGDHPATALAIAKELSILQPDADGDDRQPGVLTGRQLAAMSDAELITTAENVDVFARVSPEQKLRLVEALQAKGQVVAMTGDGVNDGPALKRADIGVAMGITGTDVAKEAADMVLTDDNFATIAAAVEEGRTVFDNLTKIIAWTLPTNIGQGLVILLALLIGVGLPILPIQVLWINMTTVALLGITLALELKEPDIMRRPPRDPDAPILTSALIWRTILVGVLILLGSFGLYEWELLRGASIVEARTAAVNAVIFIEIFYLLNCRSLTYSIFQIGPFRNRWVFAGIAGMVVLQMLFTYAPFMNSALSSAPLDLAAWWRILAIAFASYWIIELEKWIRRNRTNRRHKVQQSPIHVGNQATSEQL